MYANMNMPPPWAWGYPPMPSPANNQDPVTMITGWIKGLEELKKSMKDENKDKKPEKKGPQASLISVTLLMLLLSPITGGLVFQLFQLSLGAIHGK